MFEERCELIIEEILHPTFSFLSASITEWKCIQYPYDDKRYPSQSTCYRENTIEYHCNILGKDINKD